MVEDVEASFWVPSRGRTSLRYTRLILPLDVAGKRCILSTSELLAILPSSFCASLRASSAVMTPARPMVMRLIFPSTRFSTMNARTPFDVIRKPNPFRMASLINNCPEMGGASDSTRVLVILAGEATH